MERITFTYHYNDDNFVEHESGERTIEMNKTAQDGVHDYDICEMFCDFMKAAGFSEHNIIRYFRK